LGLRNPVAKINLKEKDNLINRRKFNERKLVSNQQKAYDAIGNGRVISAEVRGKGAEKFGIKSGDQIPLEQKIDIAADCPNGQGTRKYP
jgi:hypothetical protein